MIITEKKPFAEVIDSLVGVEKIFLVGCGECATTCKTGDSEEIAAVKAALEKHGKVVAGSCIPNAPCVAAQVKAALAKNMAVLRQADAILVLACGLGVQSVRENNRLGQAVVPALDSVCAAVVDAHGVFQEKCSLCGACVLGVTAGICPITLCPKGLLNGPCGGVSNGTCEVSPELECAWVLIYNELKKRGKTGMFQEIRAPRDYSKSYKPHTSMMEK
ncbi:MAG TPA: methylenetetrahydrofolate reductase C-terminal domain-containing protein [Candidatus Omnitrophota bacterium]|nr:methylenetetrahydrofolate reductase C-terminal domain-containing protein [Candidatus Omnitrophota bacterium]HPT07165.1 methylenetetrahydrofolate reductase C-terminal domain-containing protein [Candidatus Omnitrophota bacterium]